MLDIIIPHYNELWAVGEKLFRMLSFQRGISFGQIQVIIVNDGTEYTLPDECFSGLPYHVNQLSIPHAGVSAARNAGIKASSAEWIMFCDFDDTFTHIYALRDIMNALSQASEYDMLWTDLFIEDGKSVPWNLIKKTEEDAIFTHGKFWRRQFLIDNDLWFNEELSFNEDSEFNAIFHTKCDFRRTGHINTVIPPYVWCWRADSTTNREGQAIAAAWGHFKRNLSVCRAFEERMPLPRYCAMVTRTVYDAYYTLNGKNLQSELMPMKKQFGEWFKDHSQFFGKVDSKSLAVIENVSRAECIRADHDADSPINVWLNSLNKE